MRRHLIIYISVIMICIADAFVSHIMANNMHTDDYELDMPSYTISQKTPTDSLYVVFSHENKDAIIYANFTYSTDKQMSQAVDTIRLPYWQTYTITAWAEVGSKRSYEVYIYREAAIEHYEAQGDEDPSLSNGMNTIIPVVVMQEHFSSNESYILSPTSNVNPAEGKDWLIVTGHQQVRVEQKKAVSKCIGADNGPIDIYSAGVTEGALLFGTADGEGSQRAFIQSVNKVNLPSVIDICMQGDGKDDQQVVLQTSDDGKAWASVDTLNTEQLKPIRRYQVLLQGDVPKYVRIMSATENGNNCETWIYELAVISFVKKTSDALSQIDSCREIRSVEYYDLQGNRLSALPSGGIIIKIVRYTDESCDVEKSIVLY